MLWGRRRVESEVGVRRPASTRPARPRPCRTASRPSGSRPARRVRDDHCPGHRPLPDRRGGAEPACGGGRGAAAGLPCGRRAVAGPAVDRCALLRCPAARGRGSCCWWQPATTTSRCSAPSFEELRLNGLDADAAGALLTEQFPAGLAPDVRARLIEVTQGNPLALLELPASLNADQLAGRAPLPDPLPVSAGVERLFVERVRRLPESTQTLLLAAAAEETGDPAVILRAGRARDRRAGVREPRRLDWSASPRAAFGSAIRWCARRYTGGRRSASGRPSTERSRRRWWARSMPTVTPGIGRPRPSSPTRRSPISSNARPSGPDVAAGTRLPRERLERSAELTTAEKLRSRRLADAADAAWLAGQPDRALGLLDRVADGVLEPGLRADVAHLAG